MRGLKDKTVLLTGGANGIGAAIARRLGEEGCVVGILDLDGAGGGEGRGRDQGQGRQGQRPCRRYFRLRRGEARGGDVRGGVGAGVVPGQQRRLGPRREFPRYRSGVLEKNRRHQSLWPAERQPCGDEGHGGARLRPGGEHRLGRRPRRLVGRGGLFGLQGRHDRVCQDDVARACEQGHHHQHALPGADRHRDPAKLSGRARTAPRSPRD